MASPYTEDLALEVVLKLRSIDVLRISNVNTELVRLITSAFWMSKFIRDFGSRLENSVDYEVEYFVMSEFRAGRLYEYIAKKNYVKLLATMLPSLDCPETLIINAINKQSVEMIKILIANGANIHVQHEKALRTAIEHCNLEIAEILIDAGANIHSQDSLAFIIAVLRGNISIIELLLVNGADINARNGQIIVDASEYCTIEVLRFLIDNGADISVQNDLALIRAVQKESIEKVELLLAKGADIHAQNDLALRCACANSNSDMIYVLLEAGANKYNLPDYMRDRIPNKIYN